MSPEERTERWQAQRDAPRRGNAKGKAAKRRRLRRKRETWKRK